MPRFSHGQQQQQQQPLHSPLFPTGNMPAQLDSVEDEERKAHKRRVQNDRQKRKRARDAAAAEKARKEAAAALENQRQAATSLFGQVPPGPQHVFHAVSGPSYYPGHLSDPHWHSPDSTYTLALPHTTTLAPEPIRTSTATLHHLALASPSLAPPEPVSNVVLSAQHQLNLAPQEAPSSLQTPFKLGPEGGWTKKRKRAVSNVSAPPYVNECLPQDVQRFPESHALQATQSDRLVVAATPKRPQARRAQSSPNTSAAEAGKTPTRTLRPRTHLELTMTPMPDLGFTSVGSSSLDSPLCSPAACTSQSQGQGALFASSLLQAFNSAHNTKLREGVFDSLGIQASDLDLDAMRAGIAGVFETVMAQRLGRPKSAGQQAATKPAARPLLHQRTSSESNLSIASHAAPLYSQAPLQSSQSLPYHYLPAEAYGFATPLQPVPRHHYATHVGNFSMSLAEAPGTPTPGSQLQQRTQAQPRELAFYTPNASLSPTAYVQHAYLPGQLVEVGTPGSVAALAYSPVAETPHWHTPTGAGRPLP